MDYLEIGVAQGEHAEEVLRNKEINYIGIDMWKCVPLENEINKMKNWNTQDKWDVVYQSVLKRLEPFGKRAKIIRGSSFDILPTLDTLFDIIYVDGDHSYKGAKKDLELSLPLLKQGGKIIVDDLHYKEVRQAFQEFVQENNVQHKGDTIWHR